MIKTATTQHPVIDLIKNRWSARAFSEQALTQEEIETILEAASWAPSANNEQPWEFYYAHKNTEGFDTIFNCLMDGNKPWAKNAAALVVTVARTTFAANEKNNPNAAHDVGLATATLLLQATAMDIYCHPMGGFHKDMLKEALKFSDTQSPICVIALGRLDSPETLEEPFKTREITPRSRKPLSEIAKVV